MIFIRYINILRGAIPRFYLNLKCLISDSFFFAGSPESIPTSKKKILLIRPDGIGDFIQWLPCAQEIRNHYISLEYSITLLGNSAWLSYARTFNLFDNYFEIDRNKFSQNSLYKKELIGLVNKEAFEKAIYLAPSREFAVGDSLIRLIKSKEKIGYIGDNSNDASLWLSFSNKWYTKLIDIAGQKKYEPALNSALLDSLGIKKPAQNIPLIQIDKRQSGGFPDDYFILIPGSNMNLKQWDFKNFVEISKRIISKTGLNCIICGGKKELEIINENSSSIPFNYVNLIGKTSLEQLTSLISKAKFVLSNDTGAVHIAAGLNTPAYCIYGGGHFGRFLPYQNPGNLNRVLPTTIYNKMECFNCNWKCKYQITKNKPAKCVESVSVEQVWKEIETGLKAHL